MPTGWIELAAAACGIVSVFFVVRRNILAFPVGIAMSGLNAVLFFQQQFYAQLGVQVIFIALQIWGWTQWRGAGERIVIRQSIGARGWLLSALAVAAGIFLLGRLLKATGGEVPYLDAATSSLALTAQWWMNRRQLGHWLVWMVADLLLIVQMAFGALYWIMLLNAVLFVQSVVGLVLWYREWKRSENAAPQPSK